MKKVKIELMKTLKCGKNVWRKGEHEMDAPLHPDLQREIDLKTGKVRVFGQETPAADPAPGDSGAKTDTPPKDPTWTKSKLSRLKKDELISELQPFKEELGDLNDMIREQLFEHAQKKLLK